MLQDKIKHADYIILVLSPRSVAKRGYVQVEFRTAIDRMNYIPDSDILVLPILAEKCDVPSTTVGSISLSDLHWELIPKTQLDVFAADLAARVGGVLA